MRTRPLLAVLGIVLSAAVTVGGAPAPALAAPAGCVAASNGIVLACDHSFATVRSMGAIGLLGDSVLLGSAPGMSTPSLPTQLATKGWGPIRMTTSLGMRTYNATTTSASAYHVLSRWTAAGFNPRVIVVNLGANHFTDCTTATVNTCIARITQLLDRIQVLYPNATVWWAKTNARSLITGGFQPGMLGWNKALDTVEKARPTKLVVWDWPKAVVDGTFVMDPSQIHPSNGSQYAKRSTLIATDVTTRMPVRFVGPAVTPPAPSTGPLKFTVNDPPVALPQYPVGPTAVTKIVANPGDGAAAVTVTVHNAAAAGYVRVDRCGVSGVGTRLYFTAGQTRSVQAVTALDASGQLCLRSLTTGNVAVNVSITVQGTFAAGSGSLLTPSPTTTNQQASFVGTMATVGAAVAGADAVAATLVVDATAASAGGTLTVDGCGAAAAATAVEVSYAKGELTSGQVFAPINGSGQLCVRATQAGTVLPKVFVRVTGTFSPTGQLAFRPVLTPRVVDLRVGANPSGGWVGRRFPGQSMSFDRILTGARAATLVVTSYESTARGANVVWQRGNKPATALFYFPTGAASNTVTVRVSPNGYAIGDTTGTGVQRFAIDVAGWWVTAP